MTKNISGGKVLWSLVYVACLCLLVYQVVKFVIFAASDPVGTSMESVPFGRDKLTKMAVCVSEWQVSSLNESFPIGFGPNLETRFSSLDATGFEKFMNENQKYITDRETYLKKINGVFDVWSGGKKLRMENTFLNNERACGVLSWSRKNNGGVLNQYVAQPEYRDFQFKLPLAPRYRLFVTPYIPDSFDHLLERHLIKFRTKEGYAKAYIHLTVGAAKCEYLPSQAKCINHDDTKGLVLPIGFEEEKCIVQCVFRSVAAMYNCTPIPVYLAGDKSKPPCHTRHLDYQQVPRSLREVFLQTGKDCREEKGCSEKRSCTEWKIGLQKTKEPIYRGGKKKQDNFTVRLKVIYEPKMMLFKQYRLLSLETILGGIGGLSGLWLGLSAFGMFEVVHKLGQWLKSKKMIDIE